MQEAAKRVWDVGVGVAAPVLTVIGLLIGIHQFNVGEDNRRALEHDAAVEKDEIDFRRKLWLERLNAYRQVAELAGKVVAHVEDEKFSDALKDFTAAYWGTMILVEDKDVEKAMIAFYVETRDFQDKWGSIERLKLRADELLNACRNSEEKGRVELSGPRR